MSITVHREDVSNWDIEVVAGDHVLFGEEHSEQTFEVSEIIMHPHYNRLNIMDNDVALLKLNGHIQYNDEVSPICLPDKDVDAEYMCTVTGFGKFQLLENIRDLCRELQMNTDAQNYHISHINLSFSLLLLFSLNLGKGSENVLNQVNVPIVSRAECSHPQWYGNSITEDMVCAGYRNGGKDSCQVTLIPPVCYSSSS